MRDGVRCLQKKAQVKHDTYTDRETPYEERESKRKKREGESKRKR